ncbi:MAG: hypothetical protein ACYTXT_41815 [Nostoc sp.]
MTRRTRDRFALGVGGSYGHEDYWLGQLDPASRKSHSANADSEPRVLKSWKYKFSVFLISEDILKTAAQNTLYFNEEILLKIFYLWRLILILSMLLLLILLS